MSAAPAGGRMTAPRNGVAVRMYRQGLGDCFLLAFAGQGGPRYVLIDCGVLLGTPDADTTMTGVAESIAQATGSHLHLLVATHEHWDHLSGFSQAQEVFARIHVEEVWLAWTEDPDSPAARDYQEKRRAAVAGLRTALDRWAALDPGAGGRVRPVLEFFGATDGLGATTQDALSVIASLREQGTVLRYRRPGEGPLHLPGVDVARLYVLGPPEDREHLLRPDPKADEVYEERTLALDPEAAFYAAAVLGPVPAADLGVDEREQLERAFPFDATYRLAKEAALAGADPFYRRRYGSGEQHEAAWRRIDEDWLQAAGELALKLDNATNNTSLALAVELADGRVLLFPGDAQVGNWLSWQALSWPKEGGPPEARVRAEDLLRRTVLYKVGHHASHNATLRARGLELMDSPELVAMIPVDEAAARKPKGGNPDGWDMPFAPLLERLQQKTRGRVLRADLGLPTTKPPGLTATEWRAFRANVVQTDRPTGYVELRLAGRKHR